MRWFRDEKAEAHLTQVGLTHQYRQVKLSEIADKISLKNNARIIGASVNDDVVLSYAIAMEQPDAAFPGIVLVKRDEGYVVIDGNHRLQAYLMVEMEDKPKSIDAHIVDGSDSAIELATRSFNASNGLGQSNEEKFAHIRHLLRSPGADIAAICRSFSVRREAVTRELKIWETDQMLHDLGFRNHGLSRKHLVEFARLSDNQNVVKRVVTATLEYGLSGDRLNSLVGHVRRAKTEKTKIEAVADFCSGEAKPLADDRSISTAPNRDKCLKLLNTVRIFFSQHPSAEHCHLTANADFLQAKGLYDEVREYGDKIFCETKDAGVSPERNGKRRVAK